LNLEESVAISILGDDEILARVHRFKLFRNEGNLSIDVYEAVLGKPHHKFIAVPNLLFKESEERFFGVGDTKKDALTDCLKKIRAVSIEEIVPTEDLERSEAEKQAAENLKKMSRKSAAIWKLPKLFAKGREKIDR
jgi:hypothetical protein